jgi:hypothetical protein
MSPEQLSNGLLAIGVLIGAGFGALVHLGWKILKVLERIEAELKK